MSEHAETSKLESAASESQEHQEHQDERPSETESSMCSQSYTDNTSGQIAFLASPLDNESIETESAESARNSNTGQLDVAVAGHSLNDSALQTFSSSSGKKRKRRSLTGKKEKKQRKEKQDLYMQNRTPNKVKKTKERMHDHYLKQKECITPKTKSKKLWQSKKAMSKKRLSLTPNTKRKELDKRRKRKTTEGNQCEAELLADVQHKSHTTTAMEALINKFHQMIKTGPIYVCTCCHRLLYRKSVIEMQLSKYKHIDSDFINKVFNKKLLYKSVEDKYYICFTCDRSIKRKCLPAQSKANNLELEKQPDVLKDLNSLELRLISKRIPFMKMISLPRGKQKAIHGPAINIPTNLTPICTLLPRLPSEAQIIPLKLKRRLQYKGHYLYQCIRPDKIKEALCLLKQQNGLYSDVEINENWESNSLEDDQELWEGMQAKPPEQESCESNSVCTRNEPHDTMDTLKDYANEEGYEVIDVPKDGNCLFHAVNIELQRLNRTATTTTALRESVVKYLQENPVMTDIGHLKYFVSFRTVDDIDESIRNQDSERLSAEEYEILQQLDEEETLNFQWNKYLYRLKNGSYGDHVTLLGLAHMLQMNIHVIATNNKRTPIIFPDGIEAPQTIHLGLIGQYHFTALAPTGDVVENSDNCQDKEEEESKLKGLPYDSCLQEDDFQTSSYTYSVAPGENSRAISLLSDPQFEEMSNPDKYPTGKNAFSAARPVRITPRKYFNQRLLDADGRFAKDIEYLLAAQYAVEDKQVRDDGSIALRKGKRKQFQGHQITSSFLKDSDNLNAMLQKDQAYRFLKNVRGSPPYYQTLMYDVLGMLRQLGIPTWFLTLSAADLHWPEIIISIGYQYGRRFSSNDIEQMSWEEKCNWLRTNPVTAARQFQFRLDTFFQSFLRTQEKPIGEITDFVIRIEFQARGSPHAHCLLWVKDAPKLLKENANSKQMRENENKVCNFIDQYLTSEIPENEELRKLVELQRHVHSSSCRRNGKCRFRFPRPPSYETLISQTMENDTDTDELSPDEICKKVYHCLNHPNVDNMSLTELLSVAGVSMSDYMKSLRFSKTGRSIILKRKPSECSINSYNPDVLQAWRANTDIQFIIDAYQCIMYVVSYVMKAEKGMGDLLKQVAKENANEDIKKQIKKLSGTFLNHREVSAQEAVYRILSIPLKKVSRKVIFINTSPKEERVCLLKPMSIIETLDDDSDDIYCTTIHDRYAARPDEMEGVCLADFAANYSVNSSSNKDDLNDTVPEQFVTTHEKQKVITLKGGLGRITMRRFPAVIRFHKYKLDKDKEKYFFSKLLLYYPWRDEEALKGEFQSYECQYRKVSETIYLNERKYTQDLEVEEAVRLYEQMGPVESLWDSVAPITQQMNFNALEEGETVDREVNIEDIHENNNLLDKEPTEVKHIFKRDECSTLLPPRTYREMMRDLNCKQRQFMDFHRKWCKDAVLSLKEGKTVEPYYVFLSGPGGVGKSHIIKLVRHETIRFLRLSRRIEPEDVTVILAASTGIAAFNIDGMTLHSAFSLPIGKVYKSMSHEKLNTLKVLLGNLQLIIIDEVSMIGANTLYFLHRRLEDIKGTHKSGILFGGVSILAVGDLYQLQPVRQSFIFDSTDDEMAAIVGPLWESFQLFELDELMRQKDDKCFAELLNRMRINALTAEDITNLKSKEIDTCEGDNFSTALHVFATNAKKDLHNEKMLSSLTSPIHTIIACIRKKDSTTDLMDIEIPKKTSETGGLSECLKISVGAQVMLTVNLDVSDGLVNGARGKVVEIFTCNNQVSTVLVEFYGNAGRLATKNSIYQKKFPNAVPISRYEATFLLGRNKVAEGRILQFPLTLAWALTIHKCQGLTTDEIVVDMTGRFSAGQAYVACSRVRSSSGLHFRNFNPNKIKVSNDVEKEMNRMKDKTIPPMSEPILQSLGSEWFKILHLNVRGYVEHLPDLKSMKLLESADLLCFTETFLQPTSKVDVISGFYNIIRKERTELQKGGILICSKTDCSIKQVSTSSEIIHMSLLHINVGMINVITVYRRPSLSLEILKQDLTKLLENTELEDSTTIIIGDFNDNMNIPDFLSRYGFNQLVKHPTTDYGSLIDHIYFNKSNFITEVDVIDVYFSDHDIVCLAVKPI